MAIAGAPILSRMTASLPPPPWPLGVANRTAAALGRPRPSLDAEELIARARRRTGLRDLGAPSAEEPLARLCADLERGGLSLTGRVAARGMLGQLLGTRLEIAARLARSRGAAVERPLFVVGLPRTGTTLLHRLLACDPSARWFSEAEALYLPVDPRQRRRTWAYGLMQRLNGWLFPELAAIHDRLDPSAPEEEIALLARSFTCPVFGMFCDLPAYDAWLAGRDHAAWVDVYHYHRRQLELAQASRPGGCFVLKSPAHTMGLAALLEVYPDAVVVQTDRDPAEAVASFLSLEMVTRALFMTPARYDAAAAGHCMLGFLEMFMGRLAAARKAAPERVVTVPYCQLVADPLAAVRRIYAVWRRPLGADAESRMRAFVARNPPSKRGPHSYRLDDWGLAEEDVRRVLDSAGRRRPFPDLASAGDSRP